MIPACLPPRGVSRPKVPPRPDACEAWGGDRPHPQVEGEMPDAGHLFELIQRRTPDQVTQRRILVTNPAKLDGFPN